jgi:hypothetical protein
MAQPVNNPTFRKHASQSRCTSGHVRLAEGQRPACTVEIFKIVVTPG